MINLLPRRPRPRRRKADRKGGRPRLEDRACLDAALWLVITGGGWRKLPKEFGSRSAIRERLIRWTRGPWMAWLWEAYVDSLSEDQAQALACLVRPERRSPAWSWALAVFLRARFHPEALNYSEEQY